MQPELERRICDGVYELVRRLPFDNFFVPSAVRNNAEEVPVRILGPTGAQLMPGIALVVGNGEPRPQQVGDEVEVRRNSPHFLNWSRQQRRKFEAFDRLVAGEVVRLSARASRAVHQDGVRSWEIARVRPWNGRYVNIARVGSTTTSDSRSIARLTATATRSGRRFATKPSFRLFSNMP